MADRPGYFLSKAKAHGLAYALRACTWRERPGGDMTIELIDPATGTEVTVEVRSTRPIETKVIRGFRLERDDA